MEVIENIHETTSEIYPEYNYYQFAVKLNQGDKIDIMYNDVKVKTFNIQYTRSMAVLQLTDKGSKRTPTELEQAIYQRDRLNEKILELGGTP